MPRLPNWLPRNPGCGCLILLLAGFALLLLWGDGH
jgi:hypothetical protein